MYLSLYIYIFLQFDIPAGETKCRPISDVMATVHYINSTESLLITLQDSSSVCMGQDIEYQDSVPSRWVWASVLKVYCKTLLCVVVNSGSYRPLPPMYGEYDYLPQQRWLHALKVCVVYAWVVFDRLWCAVGSHCLSLSSVCTRRASEVIETTGMVLP